MKMEEEEDGACQEQHSSSTEEYTGGNADNILFTAAAIWMHLGLILLHHDSKTQYDYIRLFDDWDFS